MKQSKNKKDSKALFDEYYLSLYKERWDSLKKALLEEKSEQVTIQGLKEPYYLDRSSLLTASILPVTPGSKVLDMCAAPGGKSLVLALKMEGKGTLVSNDRSPNRRERMRIVFENCLPETKPEILIKGYNAESWGLYEKNEYDYILLDAPCSSERHVLNDEKYLSQWSPQRPKRLAISQYAMLSSALIALKSGGYILYSTCSINSNENEEVIEKLFKRHEEEVEEIEVDIALSEKRKHGRIILPDTSNGLGPMYLALLRKK